MLKVSATKLRSKFFDYLDRVAEGETIIIQRNNKEVARLVPTRQTNWRNKMTTRPEIMVSYEEFIKPIDDIWEDYV
jgi:prevent-host-death family protein